MDLREGGRRALQKIRPMRTEVLRALKFIPTKEETRLKQTGEDIFKTVSGFLGVNEFTRIRKILPAPLPTTGRGFDEMFYATYDPRGLVVVDLSYPWSEKRPNRRFEVWENGICRDVPTDRENIDYPVAPYNIEDLARVVADVKSRHFTSRAHAEK